MSEDIFDSVKHKLQDEREAKRKKIADQKRQSKLREQWEKRTAKQVAEALRPQQEAINLFLTSLEKHLGLKVRRAEGSRHLTLVTEKDAKKTASYSFSCLPPSYPKDTQEKDIALTITLFAQYTEGKKGAAENIDVQIAIDNPFHRGSTYSESDEDGYGSSTTYYSNLTALRNPKGDDITKGIMEWVATWAQNHESFADKILHAPKISGIKFPDETKKSENGGSVRVFVRSFNSPRYFD